MLNNPCIQIFAKITSAEFKELCSFIKKRVSTHTHEYELFRYLRSCYPHFTEENTHPELLYLQLFKGHPKGNAASNLSTIANRLHKVLQEYLIEHALKNNPQEKDFLLAYAYSRLGLQDALDKKIEQSLQADAWDNVPPDSTSSHINLWHTWNLHRLFHLKYYSRDTIKSSPREMNLKHSLEHLDLAYLQIRLRIALEMASLQSINGKSSEIQFSAQELLQIKTQAEGKNPFLFLYAQAYDLAIAPEAEKYQQFKALLLQMGNTLSKDEHGNLLTVLINFTSQAIRKGDLSYYQEAFDVLHYGLNNGVLLQDGKITPELLLNLINLSYEAGQLALMASTCQKWYEFLPHSLKQEGVHALNGRLNFHLGHFQDAIKDISQIKRFHNQLLELSARATIIQSHYELRNFEAMESSCENFTKALLRSEDRFSSLHRKSCGNFIKITQAIHQAWLNPNKSWPEKKQKLMLKAEKMLPLVCKNWVFDKIQQLP